MFCPVTRDNHLSTILCNTVPYQFHLTFRSSPTKFGFLACGVYLVPLFSFLKTTSLWHFITLIHSLDLRISVAVSFLPRFIFLSGTNTTIISDCASMDFPLVSQRLPKCQKLFSSVYFLFKPR